jgi:hypothetical protein
MGQATLPESLPVLRDEIPVAHEARPVCNELHQGDLGAGWGDLERGALDLMRVILRKAYCPSGLSCYDNAARGMASWLGTKKKA